jgi:hypothetical protein
MLDLDALCAKPEFIKFNGKDIEVQEPDVEQMLSLVNFSQSINPDSVDDVMKLIGKITELVPELKGAKLNIEQVYALVELLTNMFKTKEQKENLEKGIEVENPKEEATS